MLPLLLGWTSAAQQTLLAPSPVFGLPWMDVLGAPRLAVAIDQVVRGVNGPEERPTFGAELLAILTLIFGGDLLLPVLWPSLPPSVVLTSATPTVLFGLAHAVVSRSSVSRIVPKEPGLKWELVGAVFDGLTRAIVICTFFVDALLRHSSLAANWFALVALAWMGVYGGALVVSACGMWQREWRLSTPGELKPGGWRTVDFWAPPVFATLYLHLTHPSKSAPMTALYQNLSFLLALVLPPSLLKPTHSLLSRALGDHRQPWSAGEARALVGVLLVVLFVGRAGWNFRAQLGWGGGVKEKIKARGKAKGGKVKTR